MVLSKREFRFAMERGLGRCILALREENGPERYREQVLWHCRHMMAYDAQCEGGRSLYLHDMIRCFPDPLPFLEILSERLERSFHLTNWEYDRNCETLAYFAMEGDGYAARALENAYDRAIQVLRKKRRKRNGFFPELDNFESLCIQMVTHVNPMEEAQMNYLKIVTDMGSLLRERSVLADETMPWFQSCAENTLGKRRVARLLRERSDDPNVRAYCRAWEKEQRRWEAASPRTIAGRTRRPDVDDEPTRAQLLQDARSENEDLRGQAWSLLAKVRDDRVRAFALEQIATGAVDVDLVSMLVSNYRPEDEAVLMKLVRAFPVTVSGGEWHGAFSAVLDLFEPGRTKQPPKALLPFLYENTLCSVCREPIVKEMGRRRMLTKEMLDECVWDCNDEIRAYARKKQKNDTCIGGPHSI